MFNINKNKLFFVVQFAPLLSGYKCFWRDGTSTGDRRRIDARCHDSVATIEPSQKRFIMPVIFDRRSCLVKQIQTTSVVLEKIALRELLREENTLVFLVFESKQK